MVGASDTKKGSVFEFCSGTPVVPSQNIFSIFISLITQEYRQLRSKIGLGIRVRVRVKERRS